MFDALLGCIRLRTAALVFVIFSAATPAHSQKFRIDKISVCTNTLTSIESSCTEVTEPFDKLDRAKFKNNRIHFKVMIVCEKEAVSFIESNDNVLPVYVGVWKDGARRKGDLSIGIDQDNWEQDGDALRGLYLQQGKFPWRTRFSVGIDRVRNVSIQITDAQKNVVFVGREPARLELSFSN